MGRVFFMVVPRDIRCGREPRSPEGGPAPASTPGDFLSGPYTYSVPGSYLSSPGNQDGKVNPDCKDT